MESSFNEPEDNRHSESNSDVLPTNDDTPLVPGDRDPDVQLAGENPNFAPDAIQQEFNPIDPRQITLDRIIGLIVWAVLAIGAVVGLVIYFFSIASVDWIFGCVVGGSMLVLVLLLISSIAWPKAEFRNTFWRLEPAGLEIRRGVFWKHQISIPTSRVQHVDVSQGPLQRNFGLGTLTIHTAGTANASVELAGLEFETATVLRDQLVEQREALNVV